jgi:hypothetical protein
MPNLNRLEVLLADVALEVGIAQDLAGHGKLDRVLVAMDRVSEAREAVVLELKRLVSRRKA